MNRTLGGEPVQRSWRAGRKSRLGLEVYRRTLVLDLNELTWLRRRSEHDGITEDLVAVGVGLQASAWDHLVGSVLAAVGLDEGRVHLLSGGGVARDLEDLKGRGAGPCYALSALAVAAKLADLPVLVDVNREAHTVDYVDDLLCDRLEGWSNTGVIADVGEDAAWSEALGQLEIPAAPVGTARARLADVGGLEAGVRGAFGVVVGLSNDLPIDLVEHAELFKA